MIRPTLLTFLFLLGSFSLGCGPVLYTTDVSDAAERLERARSAGAANHAPYEYYYADACLEKAQEEAAEASYEDAVKYARAAEELASRARSLSRRRLREAGR